MKINLILEDKKFTSLMRKFDLFEDFKIIGKAVSAESKNGFLPVWPEDENYAVVGQVLSDEYKIKPGYENHLVSDSNQFTYIENVCKILQNELLEEENNDSHC